MIVSTDFEVCKVLAGQIEQGQRVMAQDIKTGQIFVAIVKIIL